MRIVSGLIVVVVLLAASCGGEGRGSPAHALPDASSALIDRLLDAIVPIDDPVYEEASRADEWLKGDDVVVGYFDAGQAWAYPVRILNFHEIVNDELAGLPALVSYCPLCGSAVVYDRRLDGDVLTFSNTSALYENDLVMVDRADWHLLVAGARARPGGSSGGRRARGRCHRSRPLWASWREEHPDTLVLARPEGGDYTRDPFIGYAQRVDAGSTPFPVSDEALADDRLSAGTAVVVATIGDETKAWPVAPARSISSTLGPELVEVTTDGIGGTVQLPSGGAVPVRVSLWFAGGCGVSRGCVGRRLTARDSEADCFPIRSEA